MARHTGFFVNSAQKIGGAKFGAENYTQNALDHSHPKKQLLSKFSPVNTNSLKIIALYETISNQKILAVTLASVAISATDGEVILTNTGSGSFSVAHSAFSPLKMTSKK